MAVTATTLISKMLAHYTTSGENVFTDYNSTQSYSDINTTLAPDPLAESTHGPLAITVATIISLSIIFTNAINLLVLPKCDNLPDISRITLVSLSVADMTLGVVCCLPGIVTAIIGYWPFGTVYCQISGIVHSAAIAVVGWMLTLLGLDRCIAISLPLRYATLITESRWIKIIVFIWVFYYALFILPLLYNQGFVYYQYSPSELICGMYWADQGLCIVSDITEPFPYLGVMIFSIYKVTKILRQLKRNQVMPASMAPDPANIPTFSNQDRKAFKVLFVNMVAFLSCWGIYLYIGTTYYCILHQFDLNRWLRFTAVWFGQCSGCINLFTYYFIYKQYRTKVNKLLTCQDDWRY